MNRLSKITSVTRAVLASISIAGAALAAPTAPERNTFSTDDMAAAARLRDAVHADNLSYRLLESLTTEVGPRLAGSAADARAVAWAEAKFKELGFDRVWKEPVHFPHWQRGVERAQILAPFAQPLHITMLGNSVGTPGDGLTAPLVQFASYKDLVNAAPTTIKGKIVFINHKMNSAGDYGTVQAGRSKGASEAARKGAVGLIIRSVGTDSHRFPHTGGMNYDDGVAKIPAAAMSGSDADMVARMMGRGQPVVLKLMLDSESEGNDTSYNVIGEITGSELPDEYVLIGGHLDSWDLGTGALDDGAGCAITMAAAEAIRRLGMKPKRSIRVVLFANEERGLHGAKAYLAKHRDQIARIQAAAEADMGQGPVTRISSYVRPEALAAAGQMHTVLEPLGIERGNNNASAGPDMGGLRNAGTATFALALKADDYFDFHHTADDTFDKVEPTRINQATAAFAVFAWMAANAPLGFGSGGESLQPAKLNR